MRPVSVSAQIERRTAPTARGSAFVSYSQRHASSCAFNDINRHQASEAEHVVNFSFPLTCGSLAVVISSIPRGITVDRLTAMEAFVRVVDAGSFSGAAKQLRIGQPAVSKAIAQLEERLGVRLLMRSTRGLTPTEAG